MMRGPGFVEMGTLSCCLPKAHNRVSETTMETNKTVTLCFHSGKHKTLKAPKREALTL